MSNRLTPRYARYGLLASLNLAAIERLRQQGEGTSAKPKGDDQARLEHLRDLLKASWQGGVVSGSIQPTKSHLSEPAGGSTRNKLDDARIVKRAIPKGYDLGGFVNKADEELALVLKDGLREVDREFLDGPLTIFLTRLAKGNRGAGPATRRSARQRVPLA
jgi:hypothetical protein